MFAALSVKEKCPNTLIPHRNPDLKFLRDCSEFLVRGGGLVLLLGGVPVSDEVSKGGVPKFYRDSIFYTQKKRNRTKQNIPFAQFPSRPSCPEELSAPWGEGVPIFDSDSQGGYQNFTVTPRGGVCVFYRHFPRKGPPSPLQEILNSPLYIYDML